MNQIPMDQIQYNNGCLPEVNVENSKYIQNNHKYLILDTRHRRSKHEVEGRIYICECGKSYLSQPALNNHKKTKHPDTCPNELKRGRGRPRKAVRIKNKIISIINTLEL